MAHPYTTTIQGLTEVIQQLRSTFPQQVTSETLKKWSIASNNEGTVLTVLRFLGVIDEEGKKQTEAAKAFVEHDEGVFAQKFEDLVKAAYKDLFDAWGDQAWSLDKNRLVVFFRTADQSSARVGEQQYRTFQALASLAGHSTTEVKPARNPQPRAVRVPQPKSSRSKLNSKAASQVDHNVGTTPAPSERRSLANNVALTVRIEINLPVSDNQEVYNNIFRSIKESFLGE